MAEAENAADGAEDMEQEESEPDEDPDDTLEHCMKRKYNAECEDGSIVVAEPKQFWHLIAPADAPAPSYVALLIGLWHYRGHEDKVQVGWWSNVFWCFGFARRRVMAPFFFQSFFLRARAPVRG